MIAQSLDAYVQPFVRGRVLFGKTAGNVAHLALRLFARDAQFKPRNSAHPVDGARPSSSAVRQRDPKFGRCGKLETGRHDADDHPRTIDQRDRPAKNFWIAAESALPQAVTEDHYAVMRRLILFRGKRAAQLRRYAQQLEQRVRRDDAWQFLRAGNTRQTERAGPT